MSALKKSSGRKETASFAAYPGAAVRLGKDLTVTEYIVVGRNDCKFDTARDVGLYQLAQSHSRLAANQRHVSGFPNCPATVGDQFTA